MKTRRRIRVRCFAAFMALLISGGALGQFQTIPFPNSRSAYGPAIAVVNGTVIAVWRGAASPNSSVDDQQLYLAAYRAGRWEAPVSLPAKSMFSPALAVHGRDLFVAWHGPGNLFTGTGEGSISFGVFKTEGGFRHLGMIPKAVSAGPPSLAVFRNRLYGAWRGAGNVTVWMVSGNESGIMYATYDLDLGKWSSEDSPPVNIVHGNSTSGPCLATVNEKLYAVWRGTGSVTFHGPNSEPGDPLIYYASFDGTSWSAKNLPLPTIPGASTAWGASAADWNGLLCVGWRGNQPWDGAKGDQLIHFAVLTEDKGWQPLDVFKDAKPASAFGPFLASDSANGELWVAWRGAYDSARGIDDQTLYLTGFGVSGVAGEKSNRQPLQKAK
jgi:hypothetical protein